MPAVRPDLRLGLAVFVVAMAATGAGIAVATSRSRDVDSGIAGRVLCPVVLEGGADCSQIRVSVRERFSDRRVATVKPSRFGRFRVALAPGAYLLELQRLQAAPAGRTTRIDVRVPPHAFVRTTIAASPMTPLR
jgi:hypothetical protein